MLLFLYFCNFSWWVLYLAFEHQRIHLETSSVLIRQLPITHVRPSPLFPVCPKIGTFNDAPSSNPLIDVPELHYPMAKSDKHRLYGWDNEYGVHDVQCLGFKASKYLVSNREFLDFINDGGYDNRSYWTEEGWGWRNYKQPKHPLFWILKDNAESLPQTERYRFRNFVEECEMPWSWPVEV